MNILSNPTATKEQLLAWVKTKKPNKLALDLLDLYWCISVENGVNPILVYCQSMKETGYLKFGGVLNETFKNPCGLKNTAGGGCTDPNAHMVFDSWAKGILAQVEHLALYAGKEGYPLKNPVDPRHFSYLLGKVKTVEGLSGNWAGGNYGEAIIKMCNEVQNMKTEEDSNVQELNSQLLSKEEMITSLNKELENVRREKEEVLNKINSIKEIVK